jgi:NADPH-dependent curcumin reductase CurA
MRIQQSSGKTWEAPHPINEVQGAGVIGEVIKSNDSSIKVGDIVNVYTGWQQYAVTKVHKSLF